MKISKLVRPTWAVLSVFGLAAVLGNGAFAVEALKPTATGDVGLAQGAVSLAHQLDLLGTDNWETTSHDPSARTLDLARVATMRRVLQGVTKRLTKIADQRDLDLSPAFRGGLKQLVTKLRVISTSAQFVDGAALGRVLTGLASEIEGRFGVAGELAKPSGLMARLRKPSPKGVAAHDAALLEMGRIMEYSAMELTLLSLPDEPPMAEIDYFLKDSGMGHVAAQVSSPESFWTGVNETLGELAQAMQNTAAEIRPLVADGNLPREYVAGMNQVWRILKNEPVKSKADEAAAQWFPGREKLRGFGRPAHCERLLTVISANGNMEMVIEGRQTKKPGSSEPEPDADSEKDKSQELLMPL